MKLQQILVDKRGFTLIEVMVVIAIIVGLFAIGSFVDMSILGRRSISAEQATLVSILQKARNQSMNNINASKHGVNIKVDSYLMFYYDNYSSQINELPMKRSSNIIIEKDGQKDFNVIFDQLSGEPTTTSLGVITLNNGTTTKTITILKSGLIDW